MATHQNSLFVKTYIFVHLLYMCVLRALLEKVLRGLSREFFNSFPDEVTGSPLVQLGRELGLRLALPLPLQAELLLEIAFLAHEEQLRPLLSELGSEARGPSEPRCGGWRWCI